MQITPSHHMLQALGSGPARPETVREVSSAIAAEAVERSRATEALPREEKADVQASASRPGSRLDVVD